MKLTAIITIITFLSLLLVSTTVPYQSSGANTALKQRLTPMQYYVTQEKGTEPPFQNQYWNNKQPGIYVDVVSKEPLFSSLDQYDSKTGWPSFTKPLVPENIVLKADNTWFSERTEVVSKQAHSHLGHVFDDGPPPTYKRYCINSAALEFIPVQEMEKKGYGKYLHLFLSPTVKTEKQ